MLAHFYSEHEPGPLRSQTPTRRSVVPALREDQRNRRPSDRLQLLPWNPGPSRGSDPSLLASHLNGPWHVICVQDGSGFCNDESLEENFYVVTQHGSAVLLNEDTFEPNSSCVPVIILRCATWAVEGMVVAGKFRSPREVVLLLRGRQRPHQQRVCQKAVRRLQQGC